MMAVEIALSNGGIALVDECDAERVSGLRWYLHIGTRGYRCVLSTNSDHIRLARLILGPPTNLQVDHISGDTLDNRRTNLRLCSNQNNTRNRAKRRGPNLFKGVRQLPSGRYQAWITVSGKHIALGTFPTAADGARAYDMAAVEHFGEFARCNLG